MDVFYGARQSIKTRNAVDAEVITDKGAADGL